MSLPNIIRQVIRNTVLNVLWHLLSHLKSITTQEKKGVLQNRKQVWRYRETTQQVGPGAWTGPWISDPVPMPFLLFQVLTLCPHHPGLGKAIRILWRMRPDAASVSSHSGHESLESGQDGLSLETLTKQILGTQHIGVHKESWGNVPSGILYPGRALYYRWGWPVWGEAGRALPRERARSGHARGPTKHPKYLPAVLIYNFRRRKAATYRRHCVVWKLSSLHFFCTCIFTILLFK